MFKKVLFVSVVFLFLGIAVFLGMTDEPLVDATAQLEQAEAYVETEDYEQAEGIYKTIIQNYPATDDALDAQAGLVMLYITWGKQPEADGAFEQLLADFSSHPDIADIINDIADTYYEYFQRYDKAGELYSYVVDNWSDANDGIWALRSLVILNLELGNIEAADAAIERLIMEHSEHDYTVKLVCEIAGEYLFYGRHEKAKQLFQYGLDNWLNNDYIVHYQEGLAILSITASDDPNAQAAVDRLAADFNDYPDVAGALFIVAEEYYMKALQLEHPDLVAQAEDSFRKVIAVCDVIITEFPEAYPATAGAYIISADCYRQLGQYEKAIEYYQKVVDSWPDYERVCSAQFLIGRCYEKLEESGDLNESEANALIEQAYKLVVEKYPASPAVRGASLELGQLNFERGQWLEAAQCWELSFKKSPENRRPVHILYPLGIAYEEMGQLDKALQAYEEFMNSVPSFDPRMAGVKARLEELGG